MDSSIGPKCHSPRKNANSLHLPDLCLGEPDNVADSSPYIEQLSRRGGRVGAMFLSEPLCDVAGVYMFPPLQLRASGRPRGKTISGKCQSTQQHCTARTRTPLRHRKLS